METREPTHISTFSYGLEAEEPTHIFTSSDGLYAQEPMHTFTSFYGLETRDFGKVIARYRWRTVQPAANEKLL